MGILVNLNWTLGTGKTKIKIQKNFFFDKKK